MGNTLRSSLGSPAEVNNELINYLLVIDIKRKTLKNGLRVVVHEDPLAPIATFNMLYRVGSRNESPERNGFAHLFEHLMFGGSKHIPDFDDQMQRVGGDSNAFTNTDFTNYYISLPADNIETAFWLDSDRLLCPAFSQEALDVQKKVVVEEFRQRYMNKPYGNYQHLFRDLFYKVHPYRWPTIGLKVEHILEASLPEVEAFFYAHYVPRNAVISIVGNVQAECMFDYAEKWFGEIDRDAPEVTPPAEPEQKEPRLLVYEADVPATRVSVAFHSCCRSDPEFHKGDLLTDILADGASSRLIQRLVKDKQTCTDANAYVIGSLDPGALVLTATVAEGVDPQTVIDQLWDEAEDIMNAEPSEYEIRKARNRQEAIYVVNQTSASSLAQLLATYEMYGDANMINTDYLAYDGISAADISAYARKVFTRQNSSTLIYRAK